MKKTTTTTSKKTSTPSGKIAKPAPVKAAVATKKPVSVTTKDPAPAPKTVKKNLPLPNVTTIIANANIGWGNQLYLRGEGGGLTWEAGIPMTCNGDDQWVWVSTSNDPAFQFKFVLNDKFWSVGENHLAGRGETHTSHPKF